MCERCNQKKGRYGIWGHKSMRLFKICGACFFEHTGIRPGDVFSGKYDYRKD